MISFEYIIAFYPLVLVFLTYISIELYDRDYAVIQFLWEPFKWCLSVLHRNNWKFISYNSIIAKSNIISAFATFIVLAYSKILYTCCFLPRYGTAILNGRLIDPSSSYYLKFNASIHYNSSYSIKIFQRGPNSIPCVNWHYLHTFMDCFQGSYKNGTNSTRDYRYFAGIYLLIRLAYQILGVIDMNYKNEYFNPYLASLLFGIFRPYRVSFYNRLDCAYFGLLASTVQVLDYGMENCDSCVILAGLIMVIHTFIVFGYGVYINLRPKKRN